MTECKKCINKECPSAGTDNNDINCPIYKKQTNGDRIRSMSDEELAEFICTNEVCKWDSGKDDIPDIIRWLQKETE